MNYLLSRMPNINWGISSLQVSISYHYPLISCLGGENMIVMKWLPTDITGLRVKPPIETTNQLNPDEHARTHTKVGKK